VVSQILSIFNIALSFSILLSAIFSFLFKPLHGISILTFCIIVVALFVFLNLTLIEKHIKSIKSINYVFGIGNILVFSGIALFSLDTSHGANAIGAAMFVGLLFIAPPLLLLFLGAVAFIAKLIRISASHQHDEIK
jgi:hypothetical protein